MCALTHLMRKVLRDGWICDVFIDQSILEFEEWTEWNRRQSETPLPAYAGEEGSRVRLRGRRHDRNWYNTDWCDVTTGCRNDVESRLKFRTSPRETRAVRARCSLPLPFRVPRACFLIDRFVRVRTASRRSSVSKARCKFFEHTDSTPSPYVRKIYHPCFHSAIPTQFFFTCVITIKTLLLRVYRLLRGTGREFDVTTRAFSRRHLM